jgi:hypothetical protein
MNNMIDNHCPVCGTEMATTFSAFVLKKYDVNYYCCPVCGLLRTEDPYWLEDAYGTAIADADTGLVARNISISQKLACVLYFLFSKEGKYLDIGGGYGLLTRLMRDFGFDFYWSDKYCENILAKGFESIKTTLPFTAAVAFEVLEHVHNPLVFIDKALSESGTKTLIFSTELYEGLPPQDDWWYYSFNTGQHISFYQKKTFRCIADKMGLNFYTNGNFHMLTSKTVNPYIYKIITGRFSNALSRIISRNVKSKTFSDHETLIKGGAK